MADEQQMNPDVEDFLAHHGVLGMKWGVRRSRGGYIGKASAAKAKSTPVSKGKDASSSKGKAPSITKAKQTTANHVAIAKKEPHPDGSVTWHVKEKGGEGTLVKAHTAVDHGKTTEARVKAAAAAHIDRLKKDPSQPAHTVQAKTTKPKKMSDEELSAAIRRMQMEKQYKQLIAEQNATPTPKSARYRKLAQQTIEQAVVKGAGQAVTNTVTTVGTKVLDTQVKKLMESIGEKAAKKAAKQVVKKI